MPVIDFMEISKMTLQGQIGRENIPNALQGPNPGDNTDLPFQPSTPRRLVEMGLNTLDSPHRLFVMIL